MVKDYFQMIKFEKSLFWIQEKVFEVNDPPATREKLEWTNVKAMSLQTYYDRKSQYKFTWELKYK